MFCLCGCGKKTNFSRGKYKNYIHGHNCKNNKELFCEVCGISSFKKRIIYFRSKNYLCNKHRLQIMRHNNILKRTIYEKNEIFIFGECAHVYIYDVKGNFKFYTIIDKKYVNDIKDIKWGRHIGYVFSNAFGFMHDYLIKLCGKIKQDNQVIDHINRNILDNRIINLRIVSKRENLINSDYYDIIKGKRGEVL